MFQWYTTGAQGNLSDPASLANLTAALDPANGIVDVWLFAHGWQQTAADFAVAVNRFGVGLGSDVRRVGGGRNDLELAIHWAASLSENAESITNVFELFTFYGDASLADKTGQNAVGPLLAAIAKCGRPVRLHLIGHSFGTRVVMSGLNALAQSGVPFTGQINAILLQAAFDNTALGPGGTYANTIKLPSLRILASTSALDKALNAAYVAATLGHKALGGAGPDAATTAAWGSRLEVQAIDDWQRAAGLLNEPFSGEHDNVFLAPLYARIVTFTGVAA